MAATSAAAPVAAVTVDDLRRSVEEVKRTVRKANREIMRTPTPRAREARASGKKMSILRACRAVWRDVNGGYPSPEALYDYCHSHKDSF